jgi:hypothetical protein
MVMVLKRTLEAEEDGTPAALLVVEVELLE